VLGELLNEISGMKCKKDVTFLPCIKEEVEIMLCPVIGSGSVPNQQDSSRTLSTKMVYEA